MKTRERRMLRFLAVFAILALTYVFLSDDFGERSVIAEKVKPQESHIKLELPVIKAVADKIKVRKRLTKKELSKIVNKGVIKIIAGYRSGTYTH